jgi:hypothetical protein
MRSTPGVRWIGTSPGAGAFAWAPSGSLAPSSLRSRLAPQCEVDPRDTRWEIPHPQPQPPPCPDRRQLADARTRPAGRRRPCPRPSRSRAARVHWPSGGPVDSTDDRGSGSCRRRCICHQSSGRRAWVIRAERVPGVDAAAPQELEWPGCWGEWPGPAGCAGAGATAWGQGNGLRAVVSRWRWPAGLRAGGRDLGRQRGARSGSPGRLRGSGTCRPAAP